MNSDDSIENNDFADFFSAFIDGEASTGEVLKFSDSAQTLSAAKLNELNEIAFQSHLIQSNGNNEHIVDIHSKVMQEIKKIPSQGQAQFKVKVLSFAVDWKTYLASAAVAASTVMGLIIYNQPTQSFQVVSGSVDNEAKQLPDEQQIVNFANNDVLPTKGNQLQHIDAEFDEDVARLINKHFMYSRISGGSAADISYIQAQYAKPDSK